MNNREYKSFKMDDLFELKRCNLSNISKLKQGDVPYVGATDRNNGVMSFVENSEKHLVKGNCMAFICNYL
ncbi:restriction endonuclease subunit S [Mycoplasmopsis agassizii]|uniref:Type I restriction modification DNA specificity domain-containing protein n=1 Tax=Mycoplasmopsis agassizii TaxID=33922 RepID=A0ABX4H4T6_9BACT|nr:restriction endonuclease subunit S [Mycoplasmopsis agassizii]PAF54822.1 hypothetical protein CJF60_03745 [Mycoplasmopsis agassizii]SMC18668.1 Type I restriction modification DNA specificity domain-containing protein [Mycoplasmopsis agassizii]